MRIGIAGPITLEYLRPYLDVGVSTWLPSGLGGTSLIYLVEELLRRGHQIVVFALDPEVEQETIFAGARLKVCIAPFRRRHRARDLFRAERNWLCRAMQRERPAIVHAHWTYEFALAALDSGLPALVSAHDAPLRILRFSPDAYRLARTTMAWQVCRRASHMTAVSSYAAGHFRRVLRYHGRMVVVPNGLPPQVFRLGVERTHVNRGGEVTFASVLSGWDGPKNGDAILYAFLLLCQRRPDVHLVLFGPECGPGGVAEQRARALGLASVVEFAGYASPDHLLHRLAAEADVLVHPSLEESFGMPAAEAMALGIPVIGGIHSGAIPDLLEQGRAGLLVDVRRPAEIAEAMLHLAERPSLRQSLASAGHRAAERRFTTAVVADGYETAYRQVLADANPQVLAEEINRCVCSTSSLN